MFLCRFSIWWRCVAILTPVFVLFCQIDSIEFAQLEQAVFNGLRAGNEVLKELHAQLDIDEINQLMDDTQEAIQYQNVNSLLLFCLHLSLSSLSRASPHSRTYTLSLFLSSLFVVVLLGNWNCTCWQANWRRRRRHSSSVATAGGGRRGREPTTSFRSQNRAYTTNHRRQVPATIVLCAHELTSCSRACYHWCCKQEQR